MIWVLDADRPSDALRCAAEVQNAIAESNAPFPPDRRIEFRKPLQLALTSSDCLMRILRPIVLQSPCPCRQVNRRRRNAAAEERSLSVTSDFGAKPCFLRSLRISRSARSAIAPTLNQHIKHLAFVIDGTSQIDPLARDAHHHLVEVPAIARPGRRWRRHRAIAGPNFSTQRRTVS